MTDTSGSPLEEGSERFLYFMIRIHVPAEDGAGSPSGIIERLGSGQKRRFVGAGELLAVLTGQATPDVKIPAADNRDNDTADRRATSTPEEAP
jgi:hypothetical protein